MKSWSLSLALALLPACYEQPTQVLVSLAADGGVTAAARAVRLRMELGEVELRDDVSRNLRWPRLIAIEPLASDPTAAFVLTVEALDQADQRVASVTLRSGFIPGETRLAKLVLAHGCSEVELAADGLARSWSEPALSAEPCRTTWSSAETFPAAAAGDTRGPVIGATGGGVAIAAWYQQDGSNHHVYASRFDSETWATPEKVTLDYMNVAALSALMADRSGRATVIWQELTEDALVTLARRFDGESWAEFSMVSSVGTLEGAGDTPLYAGSRGGSVLTVWQQRTGRSGSRSTTSRYLEGRWEEPVVVPAGGSLFDFADRPDVAIDDAGNGLAVWAHPIWLETPDGLGPADSRVAVSRLARTATAWEPPVVLDSGEPMGPALVAMENDGESAIAVWARGAGQRFSRYAPAAGWSPAQPLPSGARVGAMRMDDRGDVLAVAQLSANELVSVRFDAVSGDWLDLGPISAAEGGELSAVDFALEPGGRAVAVWIQAGAGTRAVWSNDYSPAAGWSGAIRLDPDATGRADRPRIAIDEQGHAFAVWEYEQDGVIRIRAARRRD